LKNESSPERGLAKEGNDQVKALLSNYGFLYFLLAGIERVVKEISRDSMADNRWQEYNIKRDIKGIGCVRLDRINSEL
jgi:hypothetical protein